MNSGGYTISPQTSENPDGSMNVSFDIENHDFRGAEIEHFNQTEHFNYSSDEFGEARHILADFDTQRLEPGEDDFVEDFILQDFDTNFITPQDQQYLVDQSGGQEEVNNILGWASQNLSPNESANFQHAFTTGDVALMEAALRDLREIYNENVYGDEDSQPHQPSNEDYYDVVGGQQNYNQLLNLAREHFPEDQQDRYNHVMTNGTPQQIATAIRWLHSQFN